MAPQVRIVISWTDGERMALPAIEALRERPRAVAPYYADYGLRPPLGVYNTSVQNVATRFSRVLQRVEDRVALIDSFDKSSDFEDQLLEDYDGLLDAMMEHAEDCSKILRSFFPQNANWRREAVVKKFERSIEAYRDHIGTVVNHIKHTQGRLRYTAAMSQEKIVAGYFVEGVDAAGALGPHPTIHANGHTAFSFNRDLRIHMVGLLQLSEALGTAVKSLAPDSAQKDSTHSSEVLMPILSRITKLPNLVFRKEEMLDWPRVSYRDASISNSGLFSVEFPSFSQRPAQLTGQVRVVSKHKADGVSNSFSMPI